MPRPPSGTRTVLWFLCSLTTLLIFAISSLRSLDITKNCCSMIELFSKIWCVISKPEFCSLFSQKGSSNHAFQKCISFSLDISPINPHVYNGVTCLDTAFEARSFPTGSSAACTRSELADSFSNENLGNVRPVAWQHQYVWRCHPRKQPERVLQGEWLSVQVHRWVQLASKQHYQSQEGKSAHWLSWKDLARFVHMLLCGLWD